MTKSNVKTTNESTKVEKSAIEKALEVARTTEAKASRSGKIGEVSKSIIDLLNANKAPLAIPQIVAGLNAMNVEVTNKDVANTAFRLVRNNKIAKSGVGIYAPLDSK